MGGFGDDGAETAMTQPFLETREQRFFIACLDMDHTVWRETRLRNCRGKEIGPRDDPEHLAPGPRCDPGRKKRGGRAIDRPISTTSDLMQAS
jgi:hypothetical protein